MNSSFIFSLDLTFFKLHAIFGVTFCPVFSRTPTSQRAYNLFIELIASLKKENLFDHKSYTSKGNKGKFTGMKQFKSFVWELIHIG